MPALSDWLENAILEHFFKAGGATAVAQPTNLYLALFTTDPTDDGSGTEVSGGSYARQQITLGAPTNGVSSNTNEILFPTATASWGTVTHGAIYDALTVGNLLVHGSLSSNQTIDSGNEFKIPVGNFTITLD